MQITMILIVCSDACRAGSFLDQRCLIYLCITPGDRKQAQEHDDTG